MPYRLLMSEEAKRHLWGFRKDQQQVIVDGIAAQLRHQPGVITRNRFPMRSDSGEVSTPWELRLREFRVFYDLEETPDPVVRIRAIGEKRNNRLFIEGKEVASHD